jgi:hypothetical protein
MDQSGTSSTVEGLREVIRIDDGQIKSHVDAYPTGSTHPTR